MLSPDTVDIEASGGRGGDGREDEDGFTAPWFDGRMLSEGDVGIGGGGIAFEEECCRIAARAWGEAGTVLRSGISTGRLDDPGFGRLVEGVCLSSQRGV